MQGRRPHLLLAAVWLSLLVPAAAMARTSIVEVPIGGHADVTRLERLGFDVDHAEDLTATSARIVVDSEGERARLAQAFAVREVVPDHDAYLRRTLTDDRVLDRQGRSPLPSGRDTYRVPVDYPAELDALAQAHPGLVRRVDLPRVSVEGRVLPGVEIARDVNRDDDGRPVYVVMGLHHAREWPSAEVTMELALDLARGYGSDPRITALLDRVRVFAFPVINPDGFVVSRGELPVGAGVKPLQRKNCAGDQSQPCQTRLSTDLNRNYGAYWGGNGASTNPSSDTYRGPAPWSEPESRAVWEFSQRLHITNFQSIHNIAALILRPPGFKALGLAPDEARLKLLGDAMGDAAGYSSEYGYELYEVTGATEDWNYVAQNAFGYTIELGGEPAVFQGPYQTHVVDQYLGTPGTPTEGRGVREALLLAGEQAGDVRDHAIVAGQAPAGHRIRLRKRFRTTTSPICQTDSTDSEGNCAVTAPAFELDDFLDTRLTVPESGRFEWHVAPSTRPFERKQGRIEAWELSCEAPDGTVLARRQLTVGSGQTAQVDPCSPEAAPPQVTPTQASPPPPSGQPRRTRARLRVGRVTVSRGTLARRRTVRVGLRVTDGPVRSVRAELRDARHRLVASGRRSRVTRRARITLRFRRTPPPRTYRLEVRAIDSRGLPVRGVAPLIVRR